jgi:branched-chain amino acid transport system ATP-binding protein
MLRVANLTASYGAAQALFDMSLTINDGEVVTLLGRNGAGKTTTIWSILGLIRARAATLNFDGKDLAGLRPDVIARLGIGIVPEGRQVFPDLTVRENLLATSAKRGSKDPWTFDRVMTLLPGLRDRRDHFGKTLSGGEQQMVAIGRALMTNPKLLILDEATEGLAPVVRRDIWRCLQTLKKDGQSILITDKNLNVLKRLADRHYVVEKGRTVWSGSSIDLERDAEKIHRYVGV